MNQQLILNVSPRPQTGRSASRRVRKANQIPAILYGKHSDPQTLAVDAPEFTRLLKAVAGRALIIELKGAGQDGKALSFVQEVQRDPITDRFLHVDFQEVKADEKVEVNVAVLIVGECYGVKTEGGVLEIAIHTVRVRCLPKDLPGVVEVDVTELRAGDSIKIANLKAIPGVEFRDAPGQPVVSCIEPEEDTSADATAAAAPAAKAAAKK
jgi:large subunit ribosomal protein L25